MGMSSKATWLAPTPHNPQWRRELSRCKPHIYAISIPSYPCTLTIRCKARSGAMALANKVLVQPQPGDATGNQTR